MAARRRSVPVTGGLFGLLSGAVVRWRRFSDSHTVRRTSGSAPQAWANLRVSSQVGTRSPDRMRERWEGEHPMRPLTSLLGSWAVRISMDRMGASRL